MVQWNSVGYNLRNYNKGKKMKKEVHDAMNVVKQVCGEFTGKLKDHQNIQHAINVIEAELVENIEPEKEDEKN